jgi:hypothetical protein
MLKALNITSAHEPLPDSMDFWRKVLPRLGGVAPSERVQRTSIDRSLSTYPRATYPNASAGKVEFVTCVEKSRALKTKPTHTPVGPHRLWVLGLQHMTASTIPPLSVWPCGTHYSNAQEGPDRLRSAPITDPLSRGFGIPNRSPDPWYKGRAEIIPFRYSPVLLRGKGTSHLG